MRRLLAGETRRAAHQRVHDARVQEHDGREHASEHEEAWDRERRTCAGECERQQHRTREIQ